MPCEILIVAIAKAGLTKRGYPWVVKDMPCVWGSKEAPPNWVILRITNATKAQVDHYLESWHGGFKYDILQDTPLGYRIRVRMDMVSASGMNRAIRQDIKTYLADNWNISLVSSNANEAVFDIPKPVDLQELKNDVHDVFSERFKTRHYYFTGVDVDFALANGGLIELTKAQVLNRIKNELDE